MVTWRAVLVALAEPGRRPLPFTRAALFYPDCRALEPLKTTVPVLMLLGAEDDMTPSRLCEDVSRRSTPPGMVTTVVYLEARHAFDVPELPAKMRYGLATIGHHRHGHAGAGAGRQGREDPPSRAGKGAPRSAERSATRHSREVT